jgi:hypothetical protein
LLLALVLSTPAAASAQTPAASNDGISQLLRNIEQTLLAGDVAAFRAMLLPGTVVTGTEEFVDAWVQFGGTRAIVQERVRLDTEKLPKGEGYDIYADVLLEYGRNGRVGTLLIQVRRLESAWRISGLNVLTTVAGLHRLALNTERQYTLNNFAMNAEDFELRVPTGIAFVAETNLGITAIVVLGRGTMTFSPAPEAEKGQVRIYSGADAHAGRFSALYLRAHPAEFDRLLDASVFKPAPIDQRELKRADEVFQENLMKSFGLDLGDLSRDKWSVVPTKGDLIAEMQEGRSHLTYMRSITEAEDIRFFDRLRKRTIAMYSSREKLAQRGRGFTEDDQVDFDILHHDIEASFDPAREWIEGKSTMTLTPRRGPIASVTLSLAEPLVVRSVVSRRQGYLMALRVTGQEDIIVSLTEPLKPGQSLDLEVTYGGRLPAVVPEREALQTSSDVFGLQAEPSYTFTGRSGWYPQAKVTDYATATMVLRVPQVFSAIASGRMADGDPTLVRLEGQNGQWKEYHFTATQPVRYLGWSTSRFVPVDNASFAIDESEGEPGSLTGVSYRNGDVNVVSSIALRRHARDLSNASAGVMNFYSSLLSDIPYQSFTLAFVESTQPGGHSPPYFATLSQPTPGMPISWRSDPAYFEGFPEFFLAHEAAHQWWGHAVGWKNYHEQWISEGFSQYFAALYAEHLKKASVFDSIIRQMARWTVDRSDQGPVYLGYRLGHIRNESRVFRALVYNKGALTLHMLRRLMGDDAFFRGLRRFYSTWRFRKAGTEEVKNAFEIEGGRNLERFFDRWIYGSSLPRVRFSYTTDRDAVTVKFEQIGEVFDVPITVALEYAGSSSEVVVPVTEAVTTMRIPLAGQLRDIEANADGAAPVVFVK